MENRGIHVRTASFGGLAEEAGLAYKAECTSIMSAFTFRLMNEKLRKHPAQSGVFVVVKI